MTEIPEHLLKRAQIARETAVIVERGQQQAKNPPPRPEAVSSMPTSVPPPIGLQIQTIDPYNPTRSEQIRMAALNAAAKINSGSSDSHITLLAAKKFEQYILDGN